MKQRSEPLTRRFRVGARNDFDRAQNDVGGAGMMSIGPGMTSYLVIILRDPDCPYFTLYRRADVTI